MKQLTIYHNPRCSKSREALQILLENGIKVTIVEYLKEKPSFEIILEIMEKLDVPAANLVRTKEPKYQELQFALDDKRLIAQNLEKYPELMERPIIFSTQRAIIGRPPENVKKLFD